MNKIKRIMLIGVLFFCVFSLCSCVPWWFDLYYEYDCIWYSESPYIEFNPDTYYGEMTIDGVYYETSSAYAIDGTALSFYSFGKEYNEDNLLLDGSTYVEDGELYFTITEDNISDLLGTTIVFVQHDIEDDTTTS